MLVPDSAYFVCGLLGLFAGYIVGDFQRELRWRRDARQNLRLAVDRQPGSNPDSVQYIGARTGPDSHSDSDSGPAWSLGSVRNGQARRSAVSRPDHRSSAAAAVPVRSARRSTSASVGAGYDCG